MGAGVVVAAPNPDDDPNPEPPNPDVAGAADIPPKPELAELDVVGAIAEEPNPPDWPKLLWPNPVLVPRVEGCPNAGPVTQADVVAGVEAVEVVG